MSDRQIEAKGNIERSVVIAGNNNRASLVFGDALVLPLERRQCPPPARRLLKRGALPDLLSLLAPDANKIPLVGRESALAGLSAWLNGDEDVSVTTLIARAGSGKTRLAVELCKQVDGSAIPAQHGWIAGFIRPSDLAAIAEKLATTQYHWPHPTLLVIDYAAAVHRPLADWLDRLASDTFDGKLRLLLLEREAPSGFGWWHDLSNPSGGHAVTRRDLLVDPDRPTLLSDLDPGKARHDLLVATQAVAQAMIGDAADRTPFPAFGSDAGVDSALAAPRFGNPLNLAMAGIIAAQAGSVAAFGLRRLDAARHLARHELRRIELIAEGNNVPAGAARHVLGFNNLCGGIAFQTLVADLEGELAVAGLTARGRPLADLLQQELPRPPEEPDQTALLRLGTTQPDLIGEGVIVEALLTGSPADIAAAPKLVERAYALTADRAAEALMRLIQDYGHAVEDSSASAEERRLAVTIVNLLPSLADAIPDDELLALETLILAMPANSLVLREAAAKQTERLANLWRSIALSFDEEAISARAAMWLNNLANRLSDLGQREPALAAAQEAVDLYRALAAARPDAFMPDLARSLNNLANRLSALGQREPALAAAQEAVDLRRSLAAARPDAFTSDLAGALNNLANRLSALGQLEPALAAAQEAVDLRRALAAARPDAFTHHLAGSLNNLANTLSNLGQREPALAAAQEAVDLYRALAAARPDAFTPDVSMSVHNLANMLSDLGQREPALAAAQEAVDLRRALAAARPDAFTHNLAASLTNLATRLSEVGQREPALAAAQEAVDLRRALAAARPDAFMPDLAKSLNNLANILSELGHGEPALAAAQEAVDMYRMLAAARPAAFTPDLAMCLSVLGDQLETLGRLLEALTADHKSISLLRPYFLLHPGAFGRPMMMYLRDYVRRAEVAEIEVDAELVGPIIEMLQVIQTGDGQ